MFQADTSRRLLPTIPRVPLCRTLRSGQKVRVVFDEAPICLCHGTFEAQKPHCQHPLVTMEKASQAYTYPFCSSTTAKIVNEQEIQISQNAPRVGSSSNCRCIQYHVSQHVRQQHLARPSPTPRLAKAKCRRRGEHRTSPQLQVRRPL